MASGADSPELPGALAGLADSLAAAGIEELPRTLLADAGYFSAGNVTAVTEAGINPLIATGRHRHGEEIPAAPRPAPEPTPQPRHDLTCRGDVCGWATRLGCATYEKHEERHRVPRPRYAD